MYLELDVMYLDMYLNQFSISKIIVNKREQKHENILGIALRGIVNFKISVKDLRLNGPKNCVVHH